MTKGTSGRLITFDGAAVSASTEAAAPLHNACAQALAAIGRIVAETDSVAEGMARALETLCTAIGWPIGHVYQLADDADATLTSAALWHLDQPDSFAAFQELSELTRFRSGRGLVGRVLAQCLPGVSSDVTRDKRFLRRRAAAAAGIHAWMAFPIVANQRVVAVCEFFNTECVRPDPALVSLLSCAGVVLGGLYERERWRAEREALYRNLTAAAHTQHAEHTSDRAAFAGAIAHAINSPLFAARASLALLTAEYPNTPLIAGAQADLARIAQTLERLHTLAKNAPIGQQLDDFIVER